MSEITESNLMDKTMKSAETACKETMSVVELYFYEELSKLAGKQIASQWLRSVLSHSVRSKKLSIVFSSKFCGTPESSNPSTPRSAVSSTETTMPQDRTASREVIYKCTELSQSEFPVPSRSASHELSASNDTLKSANTSPRLELGSSKTLDGDNFGLIFTDAAHAVLD